MYIIGELRTFIPKDDALELLKSSGAIFSVKDKQVFPNVFERYKESKNFSSSGSRYNSGKDNALVHLFKNMCLYFVGFHVYFFWNDDYLAGDIHRSGKRQ